MQYQTRTAETPPPTDAELSGLTRQVEALQTVISILTRDLVKMQRASVTGPALADHERAIRLITEKLPQANLAFYEALDSLRHAPRQPAHSHTHSH